jgi:hypothetical protein
MTTFFDKNGTLNIALIPADCIDDCSAGGRDAYPYITDWIERLNFTVPQKEARAYLKHFGAWDDLSQASDNEITARVLWLVCIGISKDIFDNREPFFSLSE